MSTGRQLAVVIGLALTFGGAAIAADHPGLGKPVSEADLTLWDISIGPDGKGLPPGSGTPAQGAAIFAQKCEPCHGKDGQGGSNAALTNAPGKSARTMALYVPNATTIFDFTRRAMPWPQPKSLDQRRGLCADRLHPGRQPDHRRERHHERRDLAEGADAQSQRLRQPLPGQALSAASADETTPANRRPAGTPGGTL